MESSTVQEVQRKANLTGRVYVMFDIVFGDSRDRKDLYCMTGDFRRCSFHHNIRYIRPEGTKEVFKGYNEEKV